MWSRSRSGPLNTVRPSGCRRVNAFSYPLSSLSFHRTDHDARIEMLLEEREHHEQRNGRNDDRRVFQKLSELGSGRRTLHIRNHSRVRLVLDKYCPEQFEIIGHPHGDYGLELGLKPYPRELKELNKGLRDGDLYYMKDGKPELPYRRILIQKKQV